MHFQQMYLFLSETWLVNQIIPFLNWVTQDSVQPSVTHSSQGQLMYFHLELPKQIIDISTICLQYGLQKYSIYLNWKKYISLFLSCPITWLLQPSICSLCLRHCNFCVFFFFFYIPHIRKIIQCLPFTGRLIVVQCPWDSSMLCQTARFHSYG